MVCSRETPKSSPRCWCVWGHGDSLGTEALPGCPMAAQQQQEGWEGFSFQPQAERTGRRSDMNTAGGFDGIMELTMFVSTTC